MNISVLSYSFRGLLSQSKMDVFGYLETCKYRYHLDAVDIWSGFLLSLDEDYLGKVRSAIDERNLILADLCVDGVHIWEDDADMREQNYQNAIAYLKSADILGAKFVRIDAGGRNQSWSEEQLDFIVQRYREYAQQAQDRGFKVGIENHWGPETKWEDLKKVYEAVDHPGFGISCHIGGWHGTPDEIAEADKNIAPWVCHTHIDWNICQNQLTEKLTNLWDADYQGYYSIEHHSAVNEYAEVAIQLAQVRDVLSRLRLEKPD
ncbi:MAG: TIM barrel protein [Candidatus Poribacteria bacterium]